MPNFGVISKAGYRSEPRVGYRSEVALPVTPKATKSDLFSGADFLGVALPS
jgi:hypothetical protein